MPDGHQGGYNRYMGIKAVETAYGRLVRQRLEWLSGELTRKNDVLKFLNEGGPDALMATVLAGIKAVKDEQEYWVAWLASEINDTRLEGLL